MSPGPMQPEGTSEGRGPGLGTRAGSLGPKWAGEMPATFPSNPPQGSLPIPVDPLAVSGPLQASAPLPCPSRPSGALLPSHLHLSYPVALPHVLSSHSGVPPVPLGVKVPHQCLVGALVVRRHGLCILLLRHLDSAPSAKNVSLFS